MSALDKDTKLEFPHVLVIDASAGSGKTHTLTQRFVQLILSNQISRNELANVLAITFTNNAAREMKERILNWLKKLAFDEDCDEKSQTLELVDITSQELSQKATKAVENILNRYSDFHIQTIDSFMSQVLRSSVIELKLPPGVEVTKAYDNLLDYTLSVMLKEVGKGTDKSLEKEIQEFLDLLIQEKGSFPWRAVEAVRNTFNDFLVKEGKVLEEITFEDKRNAINERFAIVTELWEKFSTMGIADKIKKSIKTAIEDKNIKTFIEKYSQNLPRLKNNQEACQSWADLAPVVTEMAEYFSVSRYYHYGQLYKRFKNLLDRVKREKEIIHINDINKSLSHYIRKETVPEIYYRLGDVLYHFLIDEFQDTDRVQWENMKPLIEESLSKEGSLFTVGDLKQAIYMFRNADYKIMREVVKEVVARDNIGEMYLPRSAIQNARVIPLKENYRCGEVILDYVEGIFKNKVNGLVGTEFLREDRTGLTRYIQNPSKGRKGKGYVETRIISGDDENAEKVALLEILNDIIKRRYNYKDIAILARKNAEIEKIVEWLTESSIPAASYSSLDIRQRKIIMEIVHLLKFLDSPIDNLAFGTFILGDVFTEAVGATSRKLETNAICDFIFKASHEEGQSEYLYIKFKESEKFKGLWNTFFEDIFNKVGYYPIYDLVSLIYRTFRVFENFQEETGFLLKFLETVGVIESKGMNSIKDLIQMVEEDNDESVFSIVLPDYIDAVKVMTFHKSKGLGFPVVINMLYDSGSKKDYTFFQKYGDELRQYYIIKAFTEKSERLKNIYEEHRLDERIEFLNCLYVTNTRAQEELYNIVKRKEKIDNPCLGLFEEYSDGAKRKFATKPPVAQPESVTLPEKVEVEFVGEEREDWSIGRLLETKRGEFFHEVLAQIEYLQDEIEVTVDKLVEDTQKNRKESYDLGEVKKILLRFLNIESVRGWFQAQSDREIQTEVEYSDEQGVLYRLDRVIIDIDKITIVDFKTGEEKMSHYRTQVKNYVKVVKKLVPQKEVKGYLGFIDTLEVEEVK